MGYALKIYKAFREYGEEKAKLLAEAFEELEKRYPQILEVTTKKDLSETELKLTKEIEQVRKELKETELRLNKEIEQIRKELKETELKLTKEIEQMRLEFTEKIEQVKLEVEQVRKELKETELRLSKEIEQVKLSTIKWVVALIGSQTIVLISSFFAILKHFIG